MLVKFDIVPITVISQPKLGHGSPKRITSNIFDFVQRTIFSTMIVNNCMTGTRQPTAAITLAQVGQ